MCLALALGAGTAGAGAQAPAPLSLDPSVAGQGVTLLVAADGSLLSQRAAAPSSIVFALPRGMRADLTSRAKLCTRAEAARAACPPQSSIGFGRYVVPKEHTR